MARNLTQVRYSALFQLILGPLLILFGVVNRLISQTSLSNAFMGIWVGLWVMITAVLGCIASRGSRPVNWAVVWSYMGFSITATFFCSIMTIGYIINLSFFDYTYEIDGDIFQYRPSARIGTTVTVLVLAIVEFGASIWSAVSCCTVQGCSCCRAASQGDATQGGFPSGSAIVYSGEAIQGPMMVVPEAQAGTPVVAIQMPS